jgi:hypothetical protein
MSGEKKRYRWRRGPILFEENICINSTTTNIDGHDTHNQHTEKTRQHWRANKNDNKQDDIHRSNPLFSPLFNETMSEKIDRILRKLHSWTDDVPIDDVCKKNHGTSSHTTSSQINYDNLRFDHNEDVSANKARSNSFLNSFRQHCYPSMQTNESNIRLHNTRPIRPYSMTFVDRALPCSTVSSSNYYPEQTSKVREQSIEKILLGKS